MNTQHVAEYCRVTLIISTNQIISTKDQQSSNETTFKFTTSRLCIKSHILMNIAPLIMMDIFD